MRAYPCCPHCADDQPHIEQDTHTVPCDHCQNESINRARIQALLGVADASARIRPNDAAWALNAEEYHRVGYGDEPEEHERMFWEAGFRQGVAAVQLLITARADRIEKP